jgi:Macrocin-O-methyltransferase (TylF)
MSKIFLSSKQPKSALPLISKAIHFFKKPSRQRSRILHSILEPIPFRLGKSKLKNVFLAYHPDSYTIFEAHAEFDSLFHKFSKFNKLNNAGDGARLWSFVLNLKQIIDENIEGDFAELGVWRGNTAAVLAHIASENSRQVFLFDTFEGFSPQDLKDLDADKKIEFKDTSVELVREVIGENNEACHFIKGYFPDSIGDIHKSRKYAAVSLDCDLYQPMKEGLNFFYPLMPRGGLFLLHDYSSMHWAGAKQAIDEFCEKTGEFLILLPDKSGSAFLRKTK